MADVKLDLIGGVTNGQYKKTAESQEATKSNTATSTSKSKDAKSTEYNQDMFLQLLVAEMQYQDPLQPTETSQYVAQLASFTQIEAIQSVQSGMENIEGNSLVGNYVTLNVNGKEITGIVDFVQKDDEKGLMVSVDGQMYEKSKITSVVDGDYYMSKYVVSLFADEVKKLPNVEEVTVKDGEKIAGATAYYNALSQYPRSYDFLEEDVEKKYLEVLAQFEKLMKAVEEADKNSEVTSDTTEKVSDASSENTAEAEKNADMNISTDNTPEVNTEDEEVLVEGATEI